MAEKQARKQEKDLTPEVDSLLPQLTALAKEGKVNEALEKLSLLEKQTRNAADLASTSRLLSHVPYILYTAPTSSKDVEDNWPTLLSQLTVYSKKHGQLKEAVVRMVDTVLGTTSTPPASNKADDAEKDKKEEKKDIELVAILDQLKDGTSRLSRQDASGGDRWLDLLDTLRDITEGKIYLELQRARLTKMLASWYEEVAESKPTTSPAEEAKPTIKATLDDEEKPRAESGSQKDKTKRSNAKTKSEWIEMAADLMTDVQVETYSSMDKREKTEFILDQMRLESARDQWPRVRVGGRKIQKAFLKEKGNSDLKLRYYALMIELALHEDKYLDACKAYQEVWDTEEVKADPVKEKEAIDSIILFIVLAPYDNEQHDMLHKLHANKDLQKSGLIYPLLTCFVNKELMRWHGIEEIYGPAMRDIPIFSPSMVDEGEDDGAKRWNALRQRIIEHNIRVIAGYYTRITLTRLNELLDLGAAEAERTLCKLVTDKIISAKIDRPAGIVDFTPKQNADEVLNAWSGDLGKMLGLIEKTSHLINKEYAIHAARTAAASAAA